MIDLGRIGRVKKNSVEIGKITAPTLSCAAGTIDLTSLGDDWSKFAIGLNSYTISFNMFMVSTDSAQNAIFTAYNTKTGLTDIEIWTDATAYYTCDISTDSEAEMLVTGYNITFDNNSAVSVAVTLTGSGPIYKVNGS
jgi:hypothetical protein